jgi:hypothetical protein
MMQGTQMSITFVETGQSESSFVTSATPTDDPVARQKLKTLLAQYARPDGSSWNVTLNLSVIESGSSPISHKVQLIGSTDVRRSLARNGKEVTSTFSNGSGVVTRDGVQENVPVWIVQSSKVPEFPFPALLTRLLDTQTFINFAPIDAADNGLIHIRLSRPCYDPQGKRQRVAEKVYEVDLFFDSSTSLLTKERHWIFSPSSMTNATQEEVRYSDFRNVGSLQIPFHSTKYLGRRVLSEAFIVSADLNAANAAMSAEVSHAK